MYDFVADYRDRLIEVVERNNLDGNLSSYHVALVMSDPQPMIVTCIRASVQLGEIAVGAWGYPVNALVSDDEIKAQVVEFIGKVEREKAAKLAL